MPKSNLPKQMIELKPNAQNRRSWPRESLAVQVKLEHIETGGFYTGHTINVGQGGALIEFDEAVPIGIDDEVKVAFTSDTEPVIRSSSMTIAVVRRVTDAQDASHRATHQPRSHAELSMHATVALEYVPGKVADLHGIVSTG